jgi:hypothetical protein
MAAKVYQLLEHIIDGRAGVVVGATIPPRRAVKIVSTSVNGISLATSTSDVLAGVVDQSTFLAGDQMGYRTFPSVVICEAGGAISRGQRCTVDSSGRAVVASSGNAQLGVAMSDATGLGDFFELHLSPLGTVAP